ncbi:MAG: GIY-YIG nuclease family protein [Fimbriimonas sp.]
MIEETTNKGEVYFIGEKEIGGRVNHTGYFKIGMVAKEGETERRLKEHQTGNPRELFIHEKIATQQPFWVESSLHQRYGQKRTRAEWHAFNPEELEKVIAEAQVLAKRVEDHNPYIRGRDALKKKVSNGESRQADQDFSEWFDTLCCAHWALSQLNTYEDDYTDLFKAHAKEVPDTDRESTKDKPTLVVVQRVNRNFKESKFKAKYPLIYNKFLIISVEDVTGSLTPVYPSLEPEDTMAKLSSKYELFGDFCSRFEELYNSVAREPQRFRELDDLYFELKGWISIFTWDKEVALARMAFFCGENDSVSSGTTVLLNWKRTAKIKRKLDKDALMTEHRSEYDEFVVETITEVTKENKS